ncbi:hypothetical protein MC885_002061 [Smutsia gigantea]|nr:hypothetical protein MC885_002061 [Smutsia gigantea]
MYICQPSGDDTAGPRCGISPPPEPPGPVVVGDTSYKPWNLSAILLGQEPPPPPPSLCPRGESLSSVGSCGPSVLECVPDSTSPGAQGLGPGSAVPGSSGVGTPRQFTRQRITRVNLRDLIFCLENERETSHSLLLYKAFLK